MLAPDDGYEEVHIRTDGAVAISRRIFEKLELAEDKTNHAEIARLRAGRVATDDLDQQSVAIW